MERINISHQTYEIHKPGAKTSFPFFISQIAVETQPRHARAKSLMNPKFKMRAILRVKPIR